MEEMGIQSMGAIVVLCYLIGAAVKVSGIGDRWIPVIAGLCGGLLGLLGLWIGVPDLNGTDPLTAAAVGVMSGLTAVGVNQVWKQMKKDE